MSDDQRQESSGRADGDHGEYGDHDEDLPEQTQVRLEKVARLRELGVDPYPPRAARTHTIAEVREQFDRLLAAPASAPAGGRDGGGDEVGAQAAPPAPEVTIAGRLVSRRDMGKSGFGHLRDGTGDFQLYLRRDLLGDEPY